MIRGRVISGFGGGEMDELVIILQEQGWTELMLQGSFRRKMGRVETREFYINGTGTASSITNTVCGISFTLTAETLSSIHRIPNRGWGHYVKKDWPPLEGNTSQLDICRRFSNDPTLSEYSSVDKGCMLPLHQMLFNVVHKILLPRKQKRTETCYLDLTLMDLLLSRTQINLPILIMIHIHSLSKVDKKQRGLAYGFWLGQVFEHFGVPVKKWQIQTISDTT